MQHPKITIRLGAAHDEVVVDGHTFDRSVMSRADKSKLRRIIVGALSK